VGCAHQKTETEEKEAGFARLKTKEEKKGEWPGFARQKEENKRFSYFLFGKRKFFDWAAMCFWTFGT